MQDLTCTKCRTRFDRVKYQPRLFPFCGHTFCTECISTHIRGQTSIGCPEDGRPHPSFDPARGIDCFPINVALMNLLNKSSTSLTRETAAPPIHREATRSHFCKQHHKLADLICLTDRKIICSKCALFGDHKNHDIREIEDFKQLVRGKVNELGTELDRLRKPVAKLQVVESADAATQRLDAKKRELFKAIEEASLSLRQELARREAIAKEQIEAVISIIAEEVSNAASGARTLLQKREVISKKLERASLLLGSQEIDFEFFLELFFSERESIGVAARLYPEMETFEGAAKAQLDQRLSGMVVTVSAEGVRRELNGLFVVESRSMAVTDLSLPVPQSAESVLKESKTSMPEARTSLILSDKVKPSALDLGLHDVSPVKEHSEARAPRPKTPPKRYEPSTTTNSKPKPPAELPSLRDQPSIQSLSSDQDSHRSNKSFDVEPSNVSKLDGNDHSDLWPTEHRPDDSSIQDIHHEQQRDDSNIEEASYSKIVPNQLRDGSRTNSQIEDDAAEDEEAFDSMTDFKQGEIEDPILNGISTQRERKNSSFLKANNRGVHQRFPSNVDEPIAVQFPNLKGLTDDVIQEYSNDAPSPISYQSNYGPQRRQNNSGNFQQVVRASGYGLGLRQGGNAMSKSTFEPVQMGEYNRYDPEPDAWGGNQRLMKRNPMAASALITPMSMLSGYSQSANGSFNPLQGSMNEGSRRSRIDPNGYLASRNSESNDYEYIDNPPHMVPAERMARREGAPVPAPKTLKFDDEFEITLKSKNINAARLPELLKAIMKNNKAKVLNLSYNLITEKGVETVLDKIVSHPSIEVINFNSNPIDESVFDVLIKKGKAYAKRIRTIYMKEVKTFKSMANIKKQINVLKRLGIKIEI